MNWIELNNEQQLKEIEQLSFNQPVVIFKNSTRCPISSSVLRRMQSAWDEQEMKNIHFYLLDIIAYRNLSNMLAQQFQVRHESPQMLIIQDGTCIYHESHYDISYMQMKEKVLTP
ncbi:MAG: bacillithiol system redox-active protein YtxJ [Candidatus Cyclobacteriaceae bacterium M3_2C_046]